jgi:plasmid stability protein
MPVLYVENVPNDLYQALRKRARENRKSIAAEVISLLERNVPTAKELQGRILQTNGGTSGPSAREPRSLSNC